ncbi:MAG: antibiotic biosynthesis monooxygenase [Chlorobi bacterium]|nr:antibiotic biosynthesis monooxygenase [Chlorobiota bacterium]
MITRIVKMSIKKDKVADFIKYFEIFNEKIKKFDGCEHHDFLEDKNAQNIFFTYTTWKTERQIERYRRSETHRLHKEKMQEFYNKEDTAWTVEKM